MRVRLFLKHSLRNEKAHNSAVNMSRRVMGRVRVWFVLSSPVRPGRQRKNQLQRYIYFDKLSKEISEDYGTQLG
jgi:hypothetical protein